MKSRLLGAVCACIFSFGLASIADAALINRGGGLIYDDALNITWLSNASAGAGSAFDDNFDPADGKMSWGNATAWVASLDIRGYTGWRLPNMDLNGNQFIVDCNVTSELDCRDNELGYMFYYNLGGTVGSPVWDSGHANLALFSNIEDPPPEFVSGSLYWSSNPDFQGLDAYQAFIMANGMEAGPVAGGSLGAWAVLDGDVSAIPVPAAAWLFGSGLLGLLGITKRKKS